MKSSSKISIINAKTAIKVFNHLAAQKDIAHEYILDGCHARAHLMCNELIEMGYNPKKAWSGFKKTDKGLFRSSMEVEYKDVGKIGPWYWHVAPILSVLNNNGIEENIVFDPALFDAPVTIKEWAEVQNISEDYVVIKDIAIEGTYGYKFSYNPYKKENLKETINKDARETMKRHKEKPLSRAYPKFKSQWLVQQFNLRASKNQTKNIITTPILKNTKPDSLRHQK